MTNQPKIVVSGVLWLIVVCFLVLSFTGLALKVAIERAVL